MVASPPQVSLLCLMNSMVSDKRNSAAHVPHTILSSLGGGCHIGLLTSSLHDEGVIGGAMSAVAKSSPSK